MKPADPAEPRELVGRLAFQVAREHLVEYEGLGYLGNTWETSTNSWRELFMRIGTACWEGGRKVGEHPPRSTSAVHSADTLKSVREALCIAQTRLGDSTQDASARYILQALINDIDRQRPLGPDGKHGNRHTPTCGCDDKPPTHHVMASGSPLPNLDIGDYLTVKWPDRPESRYHVTGISPDGTYDLAVDPPGPMLIPVAGTWRMHGPLPGFDMTKLAPGTPWVAAGTCDICNPDPCAISGRFDCHRRKLQETGQIPADPTNTTCDRCKRLAQPGTTRCVHHQERRQHGNPDDHGTPEPQTGPSAP